VETFVIDYTWLVTEEFLRASAEQREHIGVATNLLPCEGPGA
jgi:hypothetical protein